jgi:hypothetical protein
VNRASALPGAASMVGFVVTTDYYESARPHVFLADAGEMTPMKLRTK